MKNKTHELLYDTQAQFNQAQGNSGNVTSVKPGVAYITENDEVGYNKTSDIVTIVYDVSDISIPTRLYTATALTNNLKELIIDDTHIPKSSVTDTYQFTSTGIHVVRFVFSSFNFSRAIDYAFRNCTCIKSVRLPESVTTFACVGAFCGCTNMEEINIPSKVRTWAMYFFSGCSSMKKIHIKDLATYLEYDFGNETNYPFCASPGGGLYLNRKLVTEIVFPESATTVGACLLWKNIYLTSVTFSNVTTIKRRAIEETRLPHVPDLTKITSLSDRAFANCSEMEGTPEFSTGLTSIGNSAFLNCRSLSGTLDFGTSITSIGASAFTNCDHLTGSLAFPASLTSIGGYAFQSCTGISGNLVLPNTLASVGGSAFGGLPNLENVDVYNTQYTFGMSAFRFTGNGGSVVYTGNGRGILNVYGPATRGSDTRVDFKKILFHTNYNDVGGYFLTTCPTIKEIRVNGDFSGGNEGLLHTYSRGSAQLEFIEILGNATGKIIFGSLGDTALKRGGIIHLGYDGKTNLVASNIYSSNFIKNITKPKVYFGDGSSQEHDQAILNMYLEDAEWSAQSSNLDTWYNYHGEYRQE